MTETSDFTDDDLTRFIDNEVGQELSARIGSALKSDPDLKARHDAMVRASAALKANFDDLLSLAPEMPEIPDIKHEPAWNLRLVAASMAAGAVLFWGATVPFLPTEEPGWKDVVANYQSLYVTETLSVSNLTKAQQDASLQRLSDRLGFELDELPEVDGLTFVRAQELGFKGKPLAQLTFLTTDQGPVALCIVETGNDTSEAIEFAELHGLDTYSWSQDGFGILLVGPKNDSSLKETATTFRNAFSKENA